MNGVYWIHGIRMKDYASTRLGKSLSYACCLTLDMRLEKSAESRVVRICTYRSTALSSAAGNGALGGAVLSYKHTRVMMGLPPALYCDL